MSWNNPVLNVFNMENISLASPDAAMSGEMAAYLLAHLGSPNNYVTLLFLGVVK